MSAGDLGGWKAIYDFARRWYPSQYDLIIIPYSYNLSFVGLAAGATSTQQLNITANADFIHTRTSARTHRAGAAQTVSTIPMGLARVLITDSGTNEQFTAAPVDLFNYATGIAPYTLADHVYPRVVTGRSSLTVTLTSYDAAQLESYEIALHGVLVRTIPAGAHGG